MSLLRISAVVDVVLAMSVPTDGSQSTITIIKIVPFRLPGEETSESQGTSRKDVDIRVKIRPVGT